MTDSAQTWVLLIPIISIVGGVAYAIVHSVQRSRVRELEIRERIAMIERGLVPPPEVDPYGFDRLMGRYDRLRSSSGGRHRRAGITLIGIGLGLMMLIGIAGDVPEVGVGVGGFVATVGAAFLVNSLFDQRSDTPGPSRPPASAPPPSSTSPSSRTD